MRSRIFHVHDRRPAAAEREHARGVVLMAVMIAVALIATSTLIVLLRADAMVSRTGAGLRYSQSRAAAWSGIESAMAELQNQRAALLGGGSPTLTGSWSLVDGKEGWGIVVRLVDLAPGEGGTLQGEAGKVNLATCSMELLGSSGILTSGELARVQGVRDEGMSSLADLSDGSLLGESRVYGAVLLSAGSGGGASAGAAGTGTDVGAGVNGGGRIRGGGDAAASRVEGAGGGAEGVPGAASGALVDTCTVFSADPNVQVGIAADGMKYRGMARINLGLGWTEALVEPITERFGKDAVETTKQLLQGGAKFKSMRDVVAVLRQLNVPVRQWGSLLDAFTTTADPFVQGRVDMLRASERVLATVPGIDAAAAARMVAVRDRLDEGVRREITWPLVEGILSPEQFEAAVDGLTNRTLQWRVIVEAGRAHKGSSAAAQGGAQELSDRVVLECVLDVGGDRARVAYLRDLTAMDAVRSIRAGKSGSSAEAGEAGDMKVGVSGTSPLGIPGESRTPPYGEMDIPADGSGEVIEPQPLPEAGAAPQAAGDSAGVGRDGGTPARGVDTRIGRWNPPRGRGGRS